MQETHKRFEVQYEREHEGTSVWKNVWPRHSSFMAAKGTAGAVLIGRFFETAHQGYNRLIQVGDPPPPVQRVRIVDLRTGRIEWTKERGL